MSGAAHRGGEHSSSCQAEANASRLAAPRRGCFGAAIRAGLVGGVPAKIQGEAAACCLSFCVGREWRAPVPPAEG